MTTAYTKKFKQETIETLDDVLGDLELWSVYNDDAHLEDIQKIKTILDKIKGGI